MGHANVKTAQTSAKMYLQNRIIVAGNYLLKKLIFLVDCWFFFINNDQHLKGSDIAALITHNFKINQEINCA